MLITVELHNEATRVEDEIADIAPDWLLASPASGEVVLQALPEDDLSVGEFGSQLLGSTRREWVSWDSGHIPNLSEARRGFKRVDRVSLAPP